MNDQDLLIRLLGWTVQTIGRRTILILTLLLTALGSVVFGLSGLLRDQDIGLLVFLTVTGLLVGWLLARLRISGWISIGLTFIVGVLLVTFETGRLWPSLSSIIRAWEGLIFQGWPWNPANWSAFLSALAKISLPLRVLSDRLAGWIEAYVQGRPAFDPIATSMIWGLAFWTLAAWSGWATRRWNQSLAALAPVGAVLAIGLNLARGQTASLLLFLGVTFLLKATVDQYQREQTWQIEHIDYSEDLLLDLSVITLVVVIVLVTAAGLAPSLSIRKLSSLARQLTHTQAEGARLVGESLGLKPKLQPLRTNLARYAPGMPRSHLLGAGPELSQQVALVIQTGDLPPNPPYRAGGLVVPRYYWRSQTYDLYTSQGWLTSQTESQSFQAGEPVGPEKIREHRLVDQKVELMGTSNPDGNAVFVAGKLVSIVDSEYRVDKRRITTLPKERIPDDNNTDLFGAQINKQTYRAKSLIPVVSVEDLRQAGQDYPGWLSERYLALPDGIPVRVLALGRELTATQPTPYDRAKAIETYLRTFPYTLDLPAPPGNRDVVDYFLFTLKRGYCDYYATAMVVLARAAGLPARLVTGYATGTYDAHNARYIVTEANAHSWPEIYFPGYGWIEFEPTAGQPALERPITTASADIPSLKPGEDTSAVSPSAGRTPLPWRTWLAWTAAILVGTILVLILVILADTWRLRLLQPTTVLASIFRQVYRRGRSLALAYKPSDTPFEYIASLGQEVGILARNSKWSGFLLPVVPELQQLAELYALSLYSSNPAGRPEKHQAIQTWGRLRWRLWLAQLLRSWLRR